MLLLVQRAHGSSHETWLGLVLHMHKLQACFVAGLIHAMREQCSGSSALLHSSSQGSLERVLLITFSRHPKLFRNALMKDDRLSEFETTY